ncbi:cupin domain-containing protein [Rapidithrix thailandica]|uniref:Cupin domain-containing protein n=1 Tax=Rapidithrix thailandica TaxID=413964 RepID=A0AAW9S6M4_9BACT
MKSQKTPLEVSKTALFTAFFFFVMVSVSQAQGRIHRNELLTTRLKERAVSHVHTEKITFQAGQKAPRHLHPCPVLGYVVSGTVRFQVEGQPERILKAGEAFFEPAATPIVHFDNFSEKEPLVFLAYYLLQEGEQKVELLPQKVKK